MDRGKSTEQVIQLHLGEPTDDATRILQPELTVPPQRLSGW